MKNKSDFQMISILPEMVGLRLDKALSLLPEIHSRSRAENLISNDCVRVNGKTVKSSFVLRETDQIEISFPPKEPRELQPLNLKLDILFEDSDLIVINKPPGLVVHPAAGHQQDTLVNALIAHADDFSMKFGEERPGIVHRLDRETSGVLVVAKNDRTQMDLTDQFKAREVHRIYHAICLGVPAKPNGTIQSFIARHPTDRKKFASVLGPDRKILRHKEDPPSVGKWAVTHYETLKTHPSGLSYLKLKLETGRTHQIRVHLSEMGIPILADSTYGADRKVKSVHGSLNQDLLKRAPRCALHACELGFRHPKTGKTLSFKVTWPDMEEIRDLFFPGVKI
ncbi:MAG: RluA family pseudouridine synthase [Pseudobdellovibrionaceae bacterium]